MKILHVNNFFSNYGGAEHVAFNVATLLGLAGHKIFSLRLIVNHIFLMMP